MIRYLIKNNLKLMFRNKWAIFFLLIAPLLTILLVSNAFDSLMKSYEVPDEFSVGYRDSGSILSENMDTVKDSAREAGIIFTECPEGEPQELMEKNGFSAFVEFGKDEYTVYKSDKHKTECSVTEYFIGRVMQKGADAALSAAVPDTKLASALPVSRIDFLPSIDSTNYYGLIYVIWFGSLGMVSAAGVLSSEKNNGIERKYRVSTLAPAQIYLSRLIPSAAVTAVIFLIVSLISVSGYGIHWGEPLLSAAVVFMIILAAASFGFMMYSVSQNMAFAVTMLIIMVFAAGFVGGSFETYMFSGVSQSIKELSPIYHANRAVVELSAMGHSGYAASSLIYSSVMTAVCSAAAIAADSIRKKVKS